MERKLYRDFVLHVIFEFPVFWTGLLKLLMMSSVIGFFAFTDQFNCFVCQDHSILMVTCLFLCPLEYFLWQLGIGGTYLGNDDMTRWICDSNNVCRKGQQLIKKKSDWKRLKRIRYFVFLYFCFASTKSDHSIQDWIPIAESIPILIFIFIVLVFKMLYLVFERTSCRTLRHHENIVCIQKNTIDGCFHIHYVVTIHMSVDYRNLQECYDQ